MACCFKLTSFELSGITEIMLMWYDT